MLGAPHGQQGHDVTSPETAPYRRRVVAAIPEHTVRPLPRSPRSPCSGGIASTNARASCESFRFAPVRRTASGTPRPSQIRWRLLPRLARSVGFGPVWSPPYTARMEQLSTTARDQSIWSSRASQSRSAKWIRSHTPACCQSRKRRQHVIPDPHPSSCGSICQGMPLRRTKTMPVRHARSETRGRPPLWPTWWNWQERFDKIPQRIWKQRGGHTCSRYLADEDQVSEVCCYTL